MLAYTSRRYSWLSKKVLRDFEDREKSGGAPRDSFSPDADYKRRVSYHTAAGLRSPQAMGVISLMYRNRVINKIITTIVLYKVTCYMLIVNNNHINRMNLM